MIRMTTTNSPMMPTIEPAFLPRADQNETMGAWSRLDRGETGIAGTSLVPSPRLTTPGRTDEWSRPEPAGSCRLAAHFLACTVGGAAAREGEGHRA